MWKGIKKRWPGIFDNALYDALLRLGGAVGLGTLPAVVASWVKGTSGVALFNIFGVTFVSVLFLFIFIQLRRLSRNTGQHGQLASSQAHPVQLKPNQVVYPPPPSKNGVLWEWEAGQYGTGRLLGPSCPTHQVRLLYWPVNGLVDRVEHFKEDDYLGSNASFVCPIDDEEFTFIRLKGMKVGSLRTQALAQFQAEQQRKRVTEK